MGMKWPLIISIFVLTVLVAISIYGGYFDGWVFAALIFYFAMYVGGILYIKIGLKNLMNQEDELYRRKQKFDWCWERVNTILKAMPGGQGLQWASGVGRKSIYKTFHDGVQNKPFRSILAHLEFSQQLTLVLYDIDNDDIAAFITNPGPDLIENPFLNFKPFSRGGSMYDMYRGTGVPPYRRGMPPLRRGVNITVGGDDFDDFAQPRRQPPSQGTIDRAIDTLER